MLVSPERAPLLASASAVTRSSAYSALEALSSGRKSRPVSPCPDQKTSSVASCPHESLWDLQKTQRRPPYHGCARLTAEADAAHGCEGWPLHVSACRKASRVTPLPVTCSHTGPADRESGKGRGADRPGSRKQQSSGQAGQALYDAAVVCNQSLRSSDVTWSDDPSKPRGIQATPHPSDEQEASKLTVLLKFRLTSIPGSCPVARLNSAPGNGLLGRVGTSSKESEMIREGGRPPVRSRW